MTKLVVENLHLSYDAHPILNGVSFQLKAGEVVSLLGASGSGKTTLLRAVAGLEQPSDGKILLDGKLLYDGASAHNLPVEQRALGLVFQSYALWPHRSVFDNVAYGLKLRRVGTAEIRQRVDQVLTQLGLAQLAGRFPFQLSGASSSGSPLPVRWSTTRRSSCSTSRCPTWTPSCARRPVPGCAR
nr:ABC transporter ATP-binding protein [Microvirgula aerodenitrificans]